MGAAHNLAESKSFDPDQHQSVQPAFVLPQHHDPRLRVAHRLCGLSSFAHKHHRFAGRIERPEYGGKNFGTQRTYDRQFECIWGEVLAKIATLQSKWRHAPLSLPSAHYGT